MRLELDSSMSHAEQLMRSASAKQPGRKHNHKPSRRAVDRKKAQAALSAQEVKRKYRAYKNQVSAYWRGEREQYPQKP